MYVTVPSNALILDSWKAVQRGNWSEVSYPELSEIGQEAMVLGPPLSQSTPKVESCLNVFGCLLDGNWGEETETLHIRNEYSNGNVTTENGLGTAG